MKAFDPTATLPGHGQLVARLLPPSSLALPVLAFAYPLKLVSSSTAASKCLTVFMLTYGGGLVSNDEISLDVRVEPAAKLCLLTQGASFSSVLSLYFLLHIVLRPRPADAGKQAAPKSSSGGCPPTSPSRTCT